MSVENQGIEIGGYLIPQPQAEMYRVLRQAIIDDMIRTMETMFETVEEKTTETGEAYIEASNSRNQLRAVFYPSPRNIGKTQRPYEQGKLKDYLREHLLIKE